MLFFHILIKAMHRLLPSSVQKCILLIFVFVIIFEVFKLTQLNNAPSKQKHSPGSLSQQSEEPQKRETTQMAFQDPLISPRKHRQRLRNYLLKQVKVKDVPLGDWDGSKPTLQPAGKPKRNLTKETSNWHFVKDKFYVFDKECHMPKPDAFSPEAMGVFKKPQFTACANVSELVTLQYDATRQQYRLHVNMQVLVQITRLQQNDQFSCYYRRIRRGTEPYADFYSSIGPKVYFAQDEYVPRAVNYIMLECHMLNRNFSLQQDAYALLQPAAARFAQAQQTSYGTRQPSVLVIGIDSISRMNLRRTMPKTLAYLNRSGWFELQGYNKIADNTFPNLFAVHTGFTPEDAKVVCDTNDVGCFERIPFIWDLYQQSGYLTAYAEDLSEINTFTYMKPGFVQPPVAYYLHPLLVAIEKLLQIVRRFDYQYCVGRRLSFDYVFEYCQRFIQRFLAKTPVFGWFWTSSATHGHNFGAALIDAKMRDYLQVFERDGLFEHAVVIFFSDHGCRFGDLIDLSDGFLEERLPMLFIWLPMWFRHKYPQLAAALRLNRNRLTSNFDLHMTLKHILELSRPGLALLPSESCPTCQSLLHPVPSERTCAHAGISEHWCTCGPYVTVTKDAHIRFVAKLIIAHLNAYLKESNFNALCKPLSLQRLLRGERKRAFTDMGQEIISDSLGIYRIKFQTAPETGKFQATVEFNKNTKLLKSFNIANVSRLNAYHNDSSCIQHKIAKKFCFCFDNVPAKDYEYE